MSRQKDRWKDESTKGQKYGQTFFQRRLNPLEHLDIFPVIPGVYFHVRPVSINLVGVSFKHSNSGFEIWPSSEQIYLDSWQLTYESLPSLKHIARNITARVYVIL